MADVPFDTNLLPSYQSPQQMQIQAAQAQNLQANAGFTNTQNQGAQIANQRSALQLGLLQNYYEQNQPGASTSPAPGQSSTSPDETVGATGFSPDQVSSGIISKYAQLPDAPPASAVAQDAYARSIGAPELAVATYKAQVGRINQQRQLGANSVYQMAETVASAPAGAAFSTFSRINPQAAEALKAQYPNDDPDQLDADARLLAQHTGIAVHQYTGRPTDMQNGVLVDKNDDKPVLGSTQVLTGLDSGQKEKVFEDMNSAITLGNGLPGRKFQLSIDPSTGRPYTSAEAAVIAADRAARSSANTSAPNVPAQNGQTGVQAPSGNTAATPQPSAAPASSPAATVQNPYSDPNYKWQPPSLPAATDQSSAAARTDALKAAYTSRQTQTDALKASASDITSASAQALQKFQYAQDLLSKPDSYWTAGVPGAVNSQLAKWGINVPAGADRADLVKALTGGALQGLKTTYGSKPAMFDVKVNLEQAFPDPKSMSVPQLQATIGSQIRNLQYDIASAQRVPTYLRNGLDPGQFNQWNEAHYQRAAGVNPGGARAPVQSQAAAAVPTATGPNGQKMYFRNGQWAGQ